MVSSFAWNQAVFTSVSSQEGLNNVFKRLLDTKLWFSYNCLHCKNLWMWSQKRHFTTRKYEFKTLLLLALPPCLYRKSDKIRFSYEFCMVKISECDRKKDIWRYKFEFKTLLLLVAAPCLCRKTTKYDFFTIFLW